VLPGATIVLTITVAVLEPRELSQPKSATVSGGGAPSASVSQATSIEAGPVPGPVPFGLAYFTTDIPEESGKADTQAGSHPFELTASLAFNVSAREPPGGAEFPLANASPKDVEVALPPGLVGDPGAVPQCSQRAFQEGEKLNCPVDTQVGTVKPYFYGAFPTAVFPVFSIAPPPGQPAELGFSIAGIGHVPMFFHVRLGTDGYGLTVSLNDIPEAGPLQGVILSLWGVPADGSHDLEREGTLGQGGQREEAFCKPALNMPRAAPAASPPSRSSRCRAGAKGRFLSRSSPTRGSTPNRSLTRGRTRDCRAPSYPRKEYRLSPAANTCRSARRSRSRPKRRRRVRRAATPWTFMFRRMKTPPVSLQRT
jgi:hypothetical protein